jgi:hypothetical protein
VAVQHVNDVGRYAVVAEKLGKRAAGRAEVLRLSFTGERDELLRELGGLEVAPQDVRIARSPGRAIDSGEEELLPRAGAILPSRAEFTRR